MLTTIVKIELNSSITEILDKSVTENINSEIRTKFNQNTPSFGISAGTGVITFKDKDRKFIEYSSLGLLTTNAKIKIYIKNLESGKEELVGVWCSKDWQCDIDNKTITVSLRDDIEDMQNIQESSTSSIIPVKNNSMSAMKLFYYLYGGEYNGETFNGITPKNFEFADFDNDVESLLEGITIQKPYMEAGTLWTFYENLCQASLLYMHKDSEGKIRFDIIE